MSKTHADKPFDAIFDVAGDTALHKNCPKYTSQGAWFVQLGAMKETKDPSLLGVLGYLIPAKLERFRPLFLGGVPRNHRMMNGEPLDGRVQRAARLAGEGKLKVVLDSVWDLDDAKKVGSPAVNSNCVLTEQPGICETIDAACSRENRHQGRVRSGQMSTAGRVEIGQTQGTCGCENGGGVSNAPAQLGGERRISRLQKVSSA